VRKQSSKFNDKNGLAAFVEEPGAHLAFFGLKIEGKNMAQTMFWMPKRTDDITRVVMNQWTVDSWQR
jgi:hypothetical protein